MRLYRACLSPWKAVFSVCMQYRRWACEPFVPVCLHGALRPWSGSRSREWPCFVCFGVCSHEWACFRWQWLAWSCVLKRQRRWPSCWPSNRQKLCDSKTPVFGYLYAESLGFTEVHFPTYLHGNCTFKWIGHMPGISSSNSSVIVIFWR